MYVIKSRQEMPKVSPPHTETVIFRF